MLYGECLSGALYWNDFLRLARQSGFADPRLLNSRPLAITDPALIERTGATRFFSATYRLFAIDDLEDACEDHGQAVAYRGTVPGQPHGLDLDAHHHFETARIVPVCGNTWRMLQQTRLEPHFQYFGDFERHYGLFAGCGGSVPFDTVPSADASAFAAAACC